MCNEVRKARSKEGWAPSQRVNICGRSVKSDSAKPASQPASERSQRFSHTASSALAKVGEEPTEDTAPWRGQKGNCTAGQGLACWREDKPGSWSFVGFSFPRPLPFAPSLGLVKDERGGKKQRRLFRLLPVYEGFAHPSLPGWRASSSVRRFVESTTAVCSPVHLGLHGVQRCFKLRFDTRGPLRRTSSVNVTSRYTWNTDWSGGPKATELEIGEEEKQTLPPYEKRT